MSRPGWAPVALAVGLALLGGCRSESDSILVGVAGPLSRHRGIGMRSGAELAVSEINAEGGIDGRPLELVVRDDGARADRAVRIATEFYENRDLVAVVGHLTSGATLAAAPVYNGGSRPLVAISPSASNPRIRDAGPYTFRVCPHDLTHGERLADFARNRLGADRAAILYRNDDYGRGVRTAFATSFRSLGGEVVTEDPYLPEIPSFEPYISRLRALGDVDVLMVAGTAEGAERILSSVESVGVETTVMGGDGVVGIEESGAPAGGVYVSSAYLADRPGARNARFVADFRSRFGGRIPDHRAAGAYDAVHLLARVLRVRGVDREAVREGLARVGTEEPAFPGVTGTIAFDDRGEVPEKDVVIGVVRDGRLVTVGER